MSSQGNKNDNIGSLKNKLQNLSSQVLNEVRSSQSSSLQNLEEKFQEICSLHKSYDSEEAHHEIRNAREELKSEIRSKLDEEAVEDFECDIALDEIQAEAVAYVKTAKIFLEKDQNDEEIQKRIGVGIEIDDALERLGVSAPQLRSEIFEANSRLLAKRVQARVEELSDQNEFQLALDAIDECRSAIGDKLTDEIFAETCRQLESKIAG